MNNVSLLVYSLIILFIFMIGWIVYYKKKIGRYYKYRLKLGVLGIFISMCLIVILLVANYFGYSYIFIYDKLYFKVLFALLFVICLVLVILRMLYKCYSLNMENKYRYKHFIHLIVLILGIFIATFICFLIINDYIYLFGNKYEIHIILTVLVEGYMLFKYLFKKYLDDMLNKNINDLSHKLPRHYYEFNNNIYIHFKYLYLSKIYMLICVIVIVILLIFSFLYFCINSISYVYFEDVLMVIIGFIVLMLFLLEESFYFDGLVNKENNIVVGNKKIIKENNFSIETINYEYHSLFKEELLGTYTIVNNYNCKVIDNGVDNKNIIKNNIDLEFDNFLYSRVLYPIISGEDIIIESCLFSSFSDIIIPIINLMFSASKKMIIICDSIDTVYSFRKWLDELNEKNDMVNSNIVISVLDYNNNDNLKSDNNVDIYIGTVDLALNMKIIYENIDVVFGINIDKIISEDSLNLSLLGSVIGSNKVDGVQYVLFGNRVNGLKQIVSQILVRNDFKYQVVKSSIRKKIITNFFAMERGWLQSNVLPNFATQYLGQLIPLAIPSFKYNIQNVYIVSNNQPYKDQMLSLQTAQSLLGEYMKSDIINIDEAIIFSRNENFVRVCDKSVMVVTDDSYNVALLVVNWLKYSKSNMLLNIVSPSYLLRDYIVSNIDFFVGNVEIIGNILPIPKSNIKLAVYKLINQLCYGNVSEDILLRFIQKYDTGVLIDFNQDNQVRFITDSLRELTKRAFGVDIFYGSYLTSKKVTVGNGIETKYCYKLLESIKKELPDRLFKNIIFIDSEQVAKVIKKIPVFELYQNYLDGQYVVFDGKYYLIDKIDYGSGLVELINSSNNISVRYRQRREISNIINKTIIKELPILNVRNSLLTKKIICADLEVNTDGYYEFNDMISFATGEYSFKSVDTSKLGLRRVYKSTNILVINISSRFILGMSDKDRFRISFTLSVLLNEMFETLFSDIKQYILVRSVVKNKNEYLDYMKDEIFKLYRPIVDELVDDGINIYITEDTEIEKGISEAIINNFDNVIMKLLFDYLYWLVKEDNGSDSNDTGIKSLDKLSFLKYGKKKLNKCFDLEGAYNCLFELIIKGNDNLTSSRVKYNNKKYRFGKVDLLEDDKTMEKNSIDELKKDDEKLIKSVDRKSLGKSKKKKKE